MSKSRVRRILAVDRTYSLYTPRPGWAEQGPEEWRAAIRDGLQEVLAGVGASRLEA